MKSPKPSARRITTDPSGPRLDPAVHFTIHRNRESAKSLTQGILFCAKLQIMFSRRLTPLFCCLYIMRGYYFFLFSFVKWPAYCLYIVRDFLLLKLKEVLAMKETGYKSYEDLPLFLNAATVAKALGVSPSSGYELMLVVAKSTPLHPAYMPGIRSAPLLLLSP